MATDEDSADAVRSALLVRSRLLESSINGAGDDHELLSSSSSSASTTFSLIFSTFVAVCGSYVFGNALGFSSPAESGIIEDLDISVAQYSFFGSILAIGAMVGALMSGRIADFIGRRGAMWVSDIICILGWLLIGFGQDSLWLDLGRGILGCGVGLLTYAVPVYIAEITPKNLRGGYTAFNEFVVGCGVSLSYLIGSLISWRIFALSGIIPCLMQILGLFLIPESPRWLVKSGRYVEFEASLQRLRGKNADISQEANEIKDYTVYVEQISNKSLRDMFQPKYVRCIIVGVGLMVFQQFGGMKGISFYATTIFKSAGVSSKEGNIAASVSKLLMSGMSVVLINSVGRRPLLLYSAAGACLCSLIVAVSFLLIDLEYWTEVTPIFVLVGVVLYIGAYELGLASVPWIIMSEIFPIHIKGSAGSVANLMSWFGSWAVSYTFNYIFEWSSSGVFFLYSCICGLAVMFIAKLVPETKGRTLEEIQASVTGGNGGEEEVRLV